MASNPPFPPPIEPSIAWVGCTDLKPSSAQIGYMYQWFEDQKQQANTRGKQT